VRAAGRSTRSYPRSHEPTYLPRTQEERAPESIRGDDRQKPSEYRQRECQPKRTTSLTSGNTSSTWPWPDDLDAMLAAPGFHTILFEDDRVRVLDGRVAPGATVPVHTHRWGGVLYILESSDFVRRDPDGKALADTRASKTRPIAGTAVWGMPLSPHTFQNVGSDEFRTLTVEIKDDGGNHANGAT
jgi:hypothetical protein